MCLMQGKKSRNWGYEDITRAIVLRAISRKGYTYFRDKLRFPLLSLSTHQRWCRSFQCRPGVIEGAITVLKMQGQTMTPRKKIAVLSFDDMNIDSRFVYDQAEDRIMGPHKDALVIMIRGLMSGWKQPVYYNFDKTITEEILNSRNSIIITIEAAGYQVVAIVSDLGGKNNRVWSKLKILQSNCFFDNPDCQERKVWVFADTPHLQPSVGDAGPQRPAFFFIRVIF